MTGKNLVRDSVLQAIGNTPVVRLKKIVSGGMAEVLVKPELQPDRVLQGSDGFGDD